MSMKYVIFLRSCVRLAAVNNGEVKMKTEGWTGYLGEEL